MLTYWSWQAKYGIWCLIPYYPFEVSIKNEAEIYRTCHRGFFCFVFDYIAFRSLVQLDLPFRDIMLISFGFFYRF